MQHVCRCGELLLAEKLKHPRTFKKWIDGHCDFSYKTAADYMRAAKQKSRGLDFSSIKEIKEKFRKPSSKLVIRLSPTSSQSSGNWRSDVSVRSVIVRASYLDAFK